MRIRAITVIDTGKDIYRPGAEWDCRKKDAEALIACGAAVAVSRTDPEPEDGQQPKLDIDVFANSESA